MAANRNDGITIFGQFGFREGQKSGDHSVGSCPFCGDPKHFFLNLSSDNKTWDCKKCGRSGGFRGFLDQIVETCADAFTGKAAAALCTSRGIAVDTFRKVRTGYHAGTRQYILPVYSSDGKSIVTLKLYDLKTMRNAAGCPGAMYGTWSGRLDKAEDVLICEGEWDTLIAREIIEKAGIRKTAAVGVPGAGTFKSDALPIFSGKNVYLFYDNDEAGKNGADKAVRILQSVARKVFRLHWADGLPEGYDLRDLYVQNKKDARKTWEQAMAWTKEAEAPKAIAGDRPAAGDIVDSVDPVSAEEVHAVFKKWLHIPDLTLIDVVYGAIIANRLPGDPLWLFIVAPPGATKTEVLMSLSGGARIETLSTLTPHTLISGAANGGGPDPSLIPKLDGKILVVKDFTAVLGLPYAERDQIFSILRDAYDGECAKPFGNGICRRYVSKFGFLAAVTPMIEMFTEDHAALGERFLRWRNYIPSASAERRKYIQRAWDNVTHEVPMRQELNAIGRRFLRGKYETIPTVPKVIASKTIALAQMIAILRGTVVRDKYSKEIQHKSFVELGTRVSKQLHKILLGVGMFRGVTEIGAAEYAVAVHVARGSVTQRLFDTMKTAIRANGGEVSPADAAKETRLPATVAGMMLDNLVALGALKKDTTGGGHFRYLVRTDAKKLSEESGIFE